MRHQMQTAPPCPIMLNVPCLQNTPMATARHSHQLDAGAGRTCRGAGHCPAMRERDFEACRLTVRLGAIAENYKAFQRLAGPAAVAGVVKADAYGLGAELVAPALAAAGCDTFFVARLEEARGAAPAAARRRASSCWTARRSDAVPALIAHQSDAGAEFAGRDRGLERRGGRIAPQPGCRDPYRYRHEPAGPAGRGTGAPCRANGRRG